MFASGIAGTSFCPSLGICGQSNPSLQWLLSQNLCCSRNFRAGISLGMVFSPVKIGAHPQARSRGWWQWERGQATAGGRSCEDKLRDSFLWAQGNSSSAGEPGPCACSFQGHMPKSPGKRSIFPIFFLATYGNWLHLPRFPLCYQNLSGCAKWVFGHGQTLPQHS